MATAISRPIRRAAKGATAIGQLDFDQVAPLSHSMFREIESLAISFNAMLEVLKAFGRYVPRSLVMRLIKEGGFGAGTSERAVAIMFTDIVSFTAICEKMTAIEVAAFINHHLTLISACVEREGGTIDKFIGDAVMAFWGAPANNPDHAVDCCRAALACQRAVQDLGLVDDEGRAVNIRIGVNSGDMLVGNIGSEVRLNYTVIGDAVNIASRLESTNKVFGSQIIIGPETRRLAGDRVSVRELDRLAVYGRSGGLQVYELLGMADEFVDRSDWVGFYEAGLKSYRARDFTAAIADFEKVVSLRKQDQASSRMIERCKQQLETPTGDGWDDTAIALTK